MRSGLRRLAGPLGRGLSTTSSPPPPQPLPQPPPAPLAAAPPRLAVVGSGPAGFYAALRVMTSCPDARIDMYETLPVPFGLVRYGVAPDHPEVKNCQARFDDVAAAPNFRFLGNVSVGRPGHSAEHCVVPLGALLRHYDSVLMAYGASEDRRLGIPGETTLGGVYSARQFVGWYNGLPAAAAPPPDLTRGEEVAIIGQGNVALDLARMLLTSVDVLRKTDIAEHALAHLASSRVRRVRVVGRRGPMQAAFTIKEVRELMKLPDVAFHPVQRSLIPDDVKRLPRAPRRLMEVLIKGGHAPSSLMRKSWSLDNCLSPKRFVARRSVPCAVASTEFDVTSLATPHDPQSPVTPTGDVVAIASNIVIRAVGYKSVGLPGFAEAGIQFEEGRGVMVHDGFGRVKRSSARVPDDEAASMYCAGWVKTGPTGVIASTMVDAFATGDAIVQDWQDGLSLSNHRNRVTRGWEAVKQEIGPSAGLSVSWDQWRKIDSAERERGESKGKQREKFISTADMLSVIK